VSNNTTRLKRALTLPMIIFYGIGTILGSGIYVLVGKVAEEAGIYAPLAFLVSATIAFFSGLSYAELASRYPEAAGEVTYVQKAFSSKGLSTVVGLAIVLSSILSTATVFNGFVGYLNEFVVVPKTLTILVLTLVLCGFVIWGIVQSAWLIMIITFVELAGILIFIFVGGDSLFDNPQVVTEILSSSALGHWKGILGGAFIAFFAFIGFEDLVNEAEETVNPRKNIPIAIVISLVVLTVVYFLVSLIAVSAMPLEELIQSDAPLADAIKSKSAKFASVVSLVGLIASLNGAAVQFILGSRIIYGMGKKQMMPEFLSKVNAITQTPITATLLVAFSTYLIAVNFKIKELAEYTDFVLITVFTLINLSLWVLKIKKPRGSEQIRYSIAIPVIGFFLSLIFLASYVLM